MRRGDYRWAPCEEERKKVYDIPEVQETPPFYMRCWKYCLPDYRPGREPWGHNLMLCDEQKALVRFAGWHNSGIGGSIVGRLRHIFLILSVKSTGAFPILGEKGPAVAETRKRSVAKALLRGRGAEAVALGELFRETVSGQIFRSQSPLSRRSLRPPQFHRKSRHGSTCRRAIP